MAERYWSVRMLAGALDFPLYPDEVESAPTWYVEGLVHYLQAEAKRRKPKEN